jgi:PhzF family phenazine biosynthesis protein
MVQRIVQVDAFTDRPFAGNPAAVCVLPGPADEGWMQDVAREMNLSETAFLYRVAEGFNLRWFTPKVEVPLCGHATLACAHVLWEDGHLRAEEQARFHTKSGLLTADRRDGLIELDFPVDHFTPAEAPAELLQGLGAPAVNVGRGAIRYLVELENEQAVRTLEPDFGLLATIPVQGVIVTSRSTGGPNDIVSRYFAPRAGVAEDPVTGAAHCTLASYWSERLGKTEFVAYQASARGGTLFVRLEGERVKLRGQAITVMRGELAQPAPVAV